MKKNRVIISIMAFIAITFIEVDAQSKWWAGSSLQYVGGTSSSESMQNSIYLYGNLRYQDDDKYINLSIPIVFGSNGFMQLGNTFVPSNHDNSNKYESNLNKVQNSSGMMDGENGTNTTGIGLGDLYINGGVDIVGETGLIPEIGFTGYMKVPTADKSMNLGTGNFDVQLGISLRKSLGNFSLFTELGYLFIGNGLSQDYTNPMTLSLGCGYVFNNAKSSILVGYDSYSTIVQGTSSPEQLAIGYSQIISSKMTFIGIISRGLNSSTSDLSISGGLNFNL